LRDGTSGILAGRAGSLRGDRFRLAATTALLAHDIYARIRMLRHEEIPRRGVLFVVPYFGKRLVMALRKLVMGTSFSDVCEFAMIIPA
jgi:hypothetical protein